MPVNETVRRLLELARLIRLGRLTEDGKREAEHLLQRLAST